VAATVGTLTNGPPAPRNCLRQRWIVADAHPVEAAALAKEARLPQLIAELLWARGITEPQQAFAFLNPEPAHLHDPFLMLGMQAAVDRLERAIAAREPVLLYGDYDVDGTTAVVLLKTAIEMLGGVVRFHVPHRLREGYGLQSSVLEAAYAEGARLVITVDTGMRAFAEAETARRLGLDLIITDHHLPDANDALPQALAILNPNQPGCAYPEKSLCGAAIALKLAQAVLQRRDPARTREKILPSFLKMAAIATIADAVPLRGENRVIATLGLRQLRNPVGVGLRALFAAAALDPAAKQLTGFDVAFRVAPRINAAGRMDVASEVIELFTTRDSARASELALRKAIGAGQFRLVRQLFTETVVIAAVGGAAGIAFAHWGLRLLLGMAPGTIPRLAETSLDLRVLLFAGGITLAAGLLAGLAPVLIAGNINVSHALKEGARLAGGGKHRQSLRNLLVVAEVAITFVRAFGSGLLLLSLAAAQKSNPGFDTQRLLSFSLDLPSQAYRSPAAVREFYAGLANGLRRLPGVTDVSAVHCPPPAGDCGDWFYSVPGRPVPPRDQVPISLFNVADAGYFHMMGIPLRQGREFNDTDRAQGPKIAVINETLARTWWPHESAVGQRIQFGGPYQEGNLLEIVGVAGDVRQSGRDSEPMPEIYLPSVQELDSGMAVMIRTAGDPLQSMPAIRATVAALDRNLPLQRFETLEASLGAGLVRRRFSALLLGLFAGLAMVLAAVGIYGLLSYWVTSREPEIAVRLALGASPSRILRWTSFHALRLAVAGVALGAVGGWAAARFLEDLVFGIRARNPETMVAAALAGLAIALAAVAVPSWRAARVDVAHRLHWG